MVISPPFLPVPHPEESEAAWLERAMVQPNAAAQDSTAPRGSFPVSGLLEWHTGLHLKAAREQNRFIPVRAIADGEVIYLRRPTERSADPQHPLNFTPDESSVWTDNGCVILQHQTDLGATHGIPTSFTYYSLMMHMGEIDPAIELHKKLYRKDVIGRAGHIYGGEGSIHFEICCDEEQLQHLVGRPPAWVELDTAPAPTANGRTDCVWGDIAIYLPASTRTSRTRPKLAIREPSGDETRLGAPQWAIIHYEKGHCTISAVDKLGKAIGKPILAEDYEYEMYKTACELHAAAAQPAGTSSPSGWYELLRFGRNLGPDPLPAMASHWREIPTPHGPLWVELNDPNSRKFSEADFLTVLGWKFLMDDDKPLDQRCQSVQAHRLIQSPIAGDPARLEPGHKNNRLGLPEVQEKLKHAICKFPTEWDVTTVEQRLGWVRDKTQTDKPVSDRRWSEFVKHCQATCASDLPQEYKNAIWRFHPRVFIGTMAKCSWLSNTELHQMIPPAVVRGIRPGMKGPFVKERTTSTAGKLLKDHGYLLNETFRKYLVNTPRRLAAFIGNSIPETKWWETTSEDGGPNLRYSPWYGRGFLQLTNSNGRLEPASSYWDYFVFRGKAPERATRDQIEVWREEIASDQYSATDSAGAYWSIRRASEEADKISSSNSLEIMLSPTSRLHPGEKLIIYDNQYFKRVACLVNLPKSIDDSDPQIFGLADRLFVFAHVQVILFDVPKFIRGGVSTAIQEGFERRIYSAKKAK